MAGQLMPGMSTAEDLQAAGAYDEATPKGMPAEAGADQGAGAGAPPLVIQITITPNGQITVGDAAGMVEPQPADGLEDALQSAGELAKELSQRMAAKAMKEKQAARPGNADAQAIWDQMAAEREGRGNT